MSSPREAKRGRGRGRPAGSRNKTTDRDTKAVTGLLADSKVDSVQRGLQDRALKTAPNLREHISSQRATPAKRPLEDDDDEPLLNYAGAAGHSVADAQFGYDSGRDDDSNRGGRPRDSRGGDDDGHGDGDQLNERQERNKVIELIPRRQRGLGNIQDGGGRGWNEGREYNRLPSYGFAASFAPYKQTTAFQFRLTRSDATISPYSNIKLIRDLKNRNKMVANARLWYVPCTPNDPMRKLPADYNMTTSNGDPISCKVDLNGKALMALMNTLQKPVLQFSKAKTLTNFNVCQWPMARPELKMIHDGPTGGIEEEIAICFHEMELDPINPGFFSRTMKRVATVLSMCFGGADLKTGLWAVSTDFTEVTEHQKNMGHGGIRMTHEGSLRAQQEKYPWNLSSDIDPHLLQNIIEFRKKNNLASEDAEPDDEDIIPSSCRTNNPELEDYERELDENEREYCPMSYKGGLFKFKMHMSSHEVYDREGKAHKIQVAALRMASQLGACPLTALDHIRSENGYVGEDLLEPLRILVVGMLDNLGIDHRASDVDKMFDMGYSHNLSTYISEARLFEAIFKFAHKNKLSPPFVGGRRMDVTCKSEMKQWRDYANSIDRCIQKHWQLVSGSMFHLMSAKGNMKNLQIPHKDFGDDLKWAGITAMGMSEADFLQMLQDDVRNTGLVMQAENMAQAPTDEDLENIDSEWFSTRLTELKFETGFMDDVAGRNIDFPRIYRENEMIYVYVNGSFIYNHGILFEILPLGSYTRKGRYQNKNQICASNVEEKMLPDPMDCCALMSLYFDSTLNLRRVFDENIPLCLKYLEKEEVMGDPDLFKLLMAIRDAENDFKERHDGDGVKNIRDKQIKFSAGLCTHPIREVAMSADKFGDLTQMARMKDSILKQILHKTMEDVARGPLLQMSMTAKVVRSMRVDQSPKQPDFIPFHKNYSAFLSYLRKEKKVPCIPGWSRAGAQESEGQFESPKSLNSRDYNPKDFVNLMDMESMGHVFDRWSFLSLKIDVSFLNQMIISVIRNNILMVFYQCLHEACGTYSIMGDFGGTCSITVSLPNGKTKVQKYTAKASGAGIDFAVGLMSMFNGVFGKYLIHDKKLKEFFSSYRAADKLMNKISPLRIHCVLGSAIMTGPNGSYDETDQSFQETGLVLHTLELGKDEQGEGGDNMLRTLEICGGQPTGSSHNLESITWETSLGCFKMTPTRLMAPTPFITVASNQLKDIVPESTHHGGRATFLPSPVPDDAGTIERDTCGEKSNGVVGDADMIEDEPVSNESEEQPEMIGLGFEFLPTLNMSNLKVIDEQTARHNCIWFWVHFLMRRVVAYSGKTMTLHYVPREFTFNTTLAGIHKGIHQVTIGSWRFGITKQAFHRKFSSVVRTNLLIGEHLYALAMKTVLLANQMPKMTSHSDEPVVNMSEAFDNLVMTILNVPPSITTVLSTLYMWLSTDAMDMHVPVLTSFCLYTMNIQDSCPLHVLALAARGETLTSEQERKFNYIAERFCRPCCERRVTSQDNMLLNVGQLKPLLKDGDHTELFEKMFGENAQIHYDELNKLKTQRTKDWQPSTYICAHMTKKTPFETHTMPDWVVGTDGKDRKQASTKLNDWDAITSKLFADTQVRNVLLSRQQDKAQPTYHDTLKFWDAVRDGWRLPVAPKHVTDKTTMQFKTPHEHSDFYQTIFNESSQFQCGVRKTWLHMCGLSENNSTREIMTKIFKRWLDQHPGLAFPDSPAWTSKYVADPNIVPRKFAIGVNMIAKTSDKKMTLETMLGINIVDAVIGSALLLSEYRTPLNSHPNGANPEGRCWSVHNWRQMPQASLQILSLFCHMAVEKSVMPAMNAANGENLHGKGIILRGCSPYQKHFKNTTGPEIYIDERLFLDRGEILSSNSRTAQNMSIVSLHDGQQIMVYKHVSEGEGTTLIQTYLDVPHFPPESMAHAHSYCRLYQQIVKKYALTRDKTRYRPECWLAHALREYLTSMHTEGEYRSAEKFAVAYNAGVTPTYCTTQPEAEMLFVTSRYNFVFTITTNDDGTFTVTPATVCDNFEDMSFSPLPLTNQRTNFMYQDFSFFVNGGLKLMKDGSVACRHPNDIIQQKGVGAKTVREDHDTNVVEVLAAVPLPITPFPAIVSICPLHRCITVSSQCEPDVRFKQVFVYTAKNLFMQDVAQYSSEATTREWIAQNTDIPQVNDGWKLHVIYRPRVATEFGRTWINIGDVELDCWSEIDEPNVAEVLLDHVNRCEEDDTNEHDVYSEFSFSDENWEFISSHSTTFTTYLHRTCFFQIGRYKFVPKLGPDPRLSFWLSKSDDYVYISTRDELKYCLMHNDGQPMMLNEDETWAFHDCIAHSNPLLKSSDAGLYVYLPMIKSGDEHRMHEYSYTNNNFVDAWNSILLLHQKIRTVTETISYLERKAREQNRVESNGQFASGDQQIVSDMTMHIERNKNLKMESEAKMEDIHKTINTHSPTRSLETSWSIEWHTLTWSVGPCAAGDDSRPPIIGTLIRFGDVSCHAENLNDVYTRNRYIRNGQYLVSFLYEGQFWQKQMDAISTISSFKQEGSNVWIRLNAQRYTDLINSIPGVYLETKHDHFAVLHGEREVYLSGFYVISDEEAKTASKATILVLIQIQEKVSEDADFEFENKEEQKALLYVKLYDETSSTDEHTSYVTMVHTDPPLTDEYDTEPYIISNDERCVVVNYLTRTKYNTQTCRHGHFQHTKTTPNDSIYLRR